MTYREPDLATKVEELSATVTQLKTDIGELRATAKQSDRAKEWAKRWDRLRDLFDLARWPAALLISMATALALLWWWGEGQRNETGRRCRVICEANAATPAWYTTGTGNDDSRCYCRSSGADAGIVAFSLHDGTPMEPE